MVSHKKDLAIQFNIKRNEKSFIEKTKFLNRITDNFTLDKLSKKLEAFYETDFKSFLVELKKKKVTLALKEQDNGKSILRRTAKNY